MKLKRNIKVPTGNICIAEGEKGKDLEFLSLGDYGRRKNVKAVFLGLYDDIEGVPNGEIMPLTKKWVITVSTQYGCSMGCKFCDVPKVGKGVNVTYYDLINQIKESLKLHPEIEGTERLNIHYARMGEPTFNGNVLDSAMCLKRNILDFWWNTTEIHPVISTMMPKNNRKLFEFLHIWGHDVANLYQGDVGLQFSINSTSDKQRDEMFSGNSLPLVGIAEHGKAINWRGERKIALNFALADNYEVDAVKLRELFSPKKFMVKITPLHKTNSCVSNDIKTSEGYEKFTPYKKVENELRDVGFDVLVFVPSYEEDLGRITCGNAILSGSEPQCKHEDII